LGAVKFGMSIGAGRRPAVRKRARMATQSCRCWVPAKRRKARTYTLKIEGASATTLLDDAGDDGSKDPPLHGGDGLGGGPEDVDFFGEGGRSFGRWWLGGFAGGGQGGGEAVGVGEGVLRARLFHVKLGRGVRIGLPTALARLRRSDSRGSQPFGLG